MRGSREEFWHMPFDELLMVIDAWSESKEYEVRVQRHLTAWMVNCWVKKAVTGEQILPLPSDKKGKPKGYMDKKTLAAVRQSVRDKLKK